MNKITRFPTNNFYANHEKNALYEMWKYAHEKHVYPSGKPILKSVFVIQCSVNINLNLKSISTVTFDFY